MISALLTVIFFKCDVRLSSQEDAQKMVLFFNDHKTTQLKGDDTIGTREEVKALEPLKLRILAGKEEEIYWQTQERKQVRYNQVRQTRFSTKVLQDTELVSIEEEQVPTSVDSENSAKAAKQPKKRTRSSIEPKASGSQNPLPSSGESQVTTTTASKKKAKKSQGSKKSKNQHVHFSLE
jgi:hypothetical protein